MLRILIKSRENIFILGKVDKNSWIESKKCIKWLNRLINIPKNCPLMKSIKKLFMKMGTKREKIMIKIEFPSNLEMLKENTNKKLTIYTKEIKF